ncbi:carcinine hydrolase/isopenicillin-N N-acyltransferase family protein [Actinomadura sp. HBU206391]|uniref:carcinine hydrolase/isopenicillin-N N-acyltransferase family protein n=1 Tax=Actinomadura sp. HBU206391 TaxID=2731692 RepID=UPI001650A602|nr:carcinine hydrolase/isopenicillin-N N-acyltransferase family protein [Actinomadura sp. HBU206391]MBC6460286.1 linear amide C-N hydrolase [Actinomadura sp. HBU206391]
MGVRRRLLIIAVLAALLVGSGVFVLWWPSSRSATSGGATAQAFTADERRSLATLRLVDKEHPLFAMTLYGSYDLMRKITTPVTTTRPWACSLFLAAKGPKGPLFARNFDWGPNPALLLTTQPVRGPATISMVDISYVGIDRANAVRLTTDPGLQRLLLQAVALPFDGMNEHGLAVGMAAVDSAEAPKIPGRPVVGSVRIQRLVLDRARTVDEALALFRSHVIDFEEDPPLHYLLADVRGRSAVVEFVGGEMRVIRGAGAWQNMVNFVQSGATEQTKRDDRRHSTIAKRMRSTGGSLDPGSAMTLLSQVVQRHTQWSAVYELRSGSVHISVDRDYGTRYDFALNG